jgi:hypothetical protein
MAAMKENFAKLEWMWRIFCLSVIHIIMLAFRVQFIVLIKLILI